ncbi:MAG: nucleoside triphosphate pyrophosphohydrolase [Patescibacteria group bacterium]
MKYNKLVRDNIPDTIRKKGEEVITHVANTEEYWQKLKEKLKEEILEFEKDESIEEIADMLEVIDAIVDYKSFNKEEIEKIKAKKAEEKGKFKKRIILDES